MAKKSDLEEAANALLDVFEGDSSQRELHAAIDGLAVAVGRKEAAPAEGDEA